MALSPASILYTTSGTAIATLSTSPAGTEIGLVVRNIPSGIQAVSQSGTWNIGAVTSITNPVPVTDNNGSITVDGTVTLANPTATLKTNAAAINTDTAVVITAHPLSAPLSVSVSGVGSTTITDGTRVAAVTAPSTAPLATDSALVVAISPNTPIVGSTTLTTAAKGTTPQGNPTSIAIDTNTQALHVQVTNAAATLKTAAPSVTGDTALVVTVHPSTVAMPVWATGEVTSDLHTLAKGTTAAGNLTSANIDGNTQALHVQLAGTQPSIAVTGTFWQATQPVSIAAAVPVTDNNGSITVDGTVTIANPTATLKTNAAAVAGDTAVVVTMHPSTAAIPVHVGDTVSTANSSTATLLGGATFTGTAESALNYSSLLLFVYSNVSSATNGVQVQFSSDGTNWDESYTDTFVAGQGAFVLHQPVRGSYYRVIYINGATAQTSFRLQATLKGSVASGDIMDAQDSVQANDHAMLTKSILVGKTTAGGGSYVEVKVNPSGALAVDASGTTVPVVGTFWQTTQPVSIAAPVAVTGTFWQATQPVSGTVAATQSGTWTDNIATLAKGTTAAGNPTSISVDANTQALHVSLTNASIAVTGAFYQATQPVSIAAPVAVTGTFWQATQPISGTVTAVDGGGSITVDGSVTIANPSATLKTNAAPAAGDTAVVVTLHPMSGGPSSSGSSVTSVAGSATTVTLLAANSARRGATISNDSTAILYLKLGATASTTSYTVKLVTDAYYEVPFGYTGVIDGIWASAAGSARVTEIT